MTYTYPISECDVEDRSALESYRALRVKWLDWLQNTIWRDIYNMMKNDAYFRLVNQARVINDEVPNETVGLNGALHTLIDTGYITYQLMCTRRLCDNARNTISLKRLLNDLKSNINKVTREIFVCYDGLPYDYKAVHHRFLQDTVFDESVTSVATTGQEVWGMSRIMHKAFDGLSEIENRSRNDIILESVLDLLVSKLDECEDIVAQANDYIAHNGDPNRRGRYSQWNLTLERIELAQKEICQVAHVIDSKLLYHASHGGLIPEPQFDHLEHLEKGLVSEENIGSLYEFWSENKKRVNSWI